MDYIFVSKYIKFVPVIFTRTVHLFYISSKPILYYDTHLLYVCINTKLYSDIHLFHISINPRLYIHAHLFYICINTRLYSDIH